MRTSSGDENRRPAPGASGRSRVKGHIHQPVIEWSHSVGGRETLLESRLGSGPEEVSLPSADVKAFEAELKKTNPNVEFVLYPEAPHAFFSDDRPQVYKKEAYPLTEGDIWPEQNHPFLYNV